MSHTLSGPKTGFFGPMKGLDSARHTVERLSGGRLRAWIVHNMEESGETEKFVPALFEEARQHSAAISRLGR